MEKLESFILATLFSVVAFFFFCLVAGVLLKYQLY